MILHKVNENIYIKLIISIILIFIFQQFASKIGGYVAGIVDYSLIDKDNTFMWISAHHIVQMIIALIAMLYAKRIFHVDFGIRIKYSNQGVKYIVYFIITMLVYVLLTYTIGYFFKTISLYNYPLNFINIFGTLTFQLFLSGTSEGILFCALPITILSKILQCDNKKKMIISIIVSEILFSLAHIQWSLYPFEIITLDLFQIIYAFFLGIAYGIVYMKTNSVIYPIIMHGMSNFIMVGIGYIVMIFILQ